MSVQLPRARPQGLPRDQHFIPRMHLSGFKPDPQPSLLARFDKTTGRIRPVSVARTAVVKDYNTLPAQTGHPSDALEQQFTKLEGLVAPWLRRARSVQEPGRIEVCPNYEVPVKPAEEVGALAQTAASEPDHRMRICLPM